MKIQIIQNDNILRVYHHPRDVIVKPKAKEVHIFNYDGTILEKFELINHELGWIQDIDSDENEISVRLMVGKILTK